MEILLVLNTAIKSQECLKAGFFCQRQQLSVFLPGQAHFRHRMAIVPGQKASEFSGDALVE